MEKVTRKTRAKTVLKNWINQYPSSNFDIREMLKALGDNPNPNDVDKIIGNKSWTAVPDCDECGKSFSIVVTIGEEPDYESSTADICKNCLKKALKLFDNSKEVDK